MRIAQSDINQLFLDMTLSLATKIKMYFAVKRRYWF